MLNVLCSNVAARACAQLLSICARLIVGLAWDRIPAQSPNHSLWSPGLVVRPSYSTGLQVNVQLPFRDTGICSNQPDY